MPKINVLYSSRHRIKIKKCVLYVSVNLFECLDLKCVYLITLEFGFIVKTR